METTQTSLIPVEVTPGSKSSSSLIQIDSIYIDLKFPKQTEVMSCSQHNFSMRGYVSEVRTKNLHATIPFQSHGPVNDSDEQLPPMHVPRFRWWRCAECRGLISRTCATEENDTTSNCCTQALLPSSTSLCTSSHDETTMLLPTETQEGPILEHNGGIRDVDVNNSPNMDVPHGSLPLSDHQKTNNAGNGELVPQGIIKSSENWDLVPIDYENKLHEPAYHEVGDIRDEEAVNQVGNVLETNNKEGHDQEINGEVESSKDGNLAQVHELERSDLQERTGDRSFPNTSSRSDNSQRRDGSSCSRRKNPKLRLLTDLLSDEVKIKNKRVKGPAPAPGKRSLSKEDFQKSASGFRSPPSASEINSASGTTLQIGNKADRKCKSERVSEWKTEAVGKRKRKLHKVHGEFSGIRDQEEYTGKSNSKNGYLLLDQFKAAKNSVFQTQTEKGKSIADSSLAVTKISKSIAPSNDGSSNLGLDLSLSCLLNLNVSSAEVTKSTNNHLNKTSLHSEQLTAMRPAEPDLSWKKRRAWDLNAREAPNFSNVLEKEPFPLLKEMDFLQLHRKENDFEVQGCLSGSNRGSDKSRGRGLQQGSSDDIQEIVELMARNQFERGLGGGVRRLPEVHGFGMAKQQTKPIPGISRFSPFNASRGSCSNFSHVDRNPLKMGKVHDNQLNIFNIYSDKVILTGEKQLSANASVRPEGFPSEFAVPQKSANLRMEVEHKGKTISDLRADELKKAREAHGLWSKLGNYEFNPAKKRHLDPYANDSIPAMQLLSLMDGSSPGTSDNMGRSRIIDRPFSPCGYHPRYHSDGREDFINGSLFFHQSHGKELPGLGTGLYTTKGSSGQPAISLSRQSPFIVPERKERKKTHVPWSTDAGQSSKLGRSTGAPLRHDFSRRHGNLEIRTRQDVGPVRITIPNEICTINRNPADFSIPEEGNVFTICGTELKFPKRKYSRGRPRSLDNGAPKRQRVTKKKVGEQHVPFSMMIP